MRHGLQALIPYGVALSLAFTVSTSVSAAEGDSPSSEKPIISGEIAIEIQNDWTKDTENSTEMNDLTTKIEPSFRVRLAPSWSIDVGWNHVT